MNIDNAAKIVDIWGKHLEFANPLLMQYFGAQIPESSLPFSKEIIEEAVSIMIDTHTEERLINGLKIGIATLHAYCSDKEALEAAARNFPSEDWRNFMLGRKDRFQQNRIKDFISYYGIDY